MSPLPPKPESRESATIRADAFACFHPVSAEWFKAVFDAPTAPQRMGWPVIARGENALILAPTGTGKTLAAFLWCLDRLMLQSREQGDNGTSHPSEHRPLAPPLRDPGRERETREQATGKRDQQGFDAERKGCRIVYVSPLK